MPRPSHRAARLAAVLLMALGLATPAGAQPWVPEPVPGAPPAGPNRFHGRLTDAIDLADRSRRPLVVIFTAEGCRSCDIMGDTVLQEESVRAAMSPYIEVVVDLGTEEGKSVARAYGVPDAPAILILRADGSELRPARMLGPQRARDVTWRLRAAARDPSVVAPAHPDLPTEGAPPELQRREPRFLSTLLLAVTCIAGISLILATRRRRAR